MEEDLVARLTSAQAVAAIVGDNVNWFERTRGAFAELTLFKVSPGREWNHNGPDGLDRPRIQFDCWAGSAETAAALGRAVVGEMEQARAVGGTRFWPGQLLAEDWTSEGEDGGGTPVFRARLDFEFFHERT